MTMPKELKGYKCPDKECYECEFLKAKCIVYLAEGKKKYKQWKKEQLNKMEKLTVEECGKKWRGVTYDEEI